MQAASATQTETANAAVMSRESDAAADSRATAPGRQAGAATAPDPATVLRRALQTFLAVAALGLLAAVVIATRRTRARRPVTVAHGRRRL
jgi:hypothetical protein